MLACLTLGNLRLLHSLIVGLGLLTYLRAACTLDLAKLAIAQHKFDHSISANGVEEHATPIAVTIATDIPTPLPWGLLLS